MSATTQVAQTNPRPTEKDITGPVLSKIDTFQQAGELHLPQGYSAANALKSAWLLLLEVKDRDGRLALDVCSRESVANALLKMVVWGLSPLKKQCDFIVYGDKLSCDPEYTGNLVLAKRYGGLKEYKPRAIFKGDVFEFETETTFPYRTKILKHEQKLENIGGEVVGAYFAYELNSGAQDVEIMNINQIRAAWKQGAAKGNSPAHQNFSDQMAIKSVINRGCKLLIRASDDSVLFEGEGGDLDKQKDSVDNEISQNANKQEMSFEDADVIETSLKQGINSASDGTLSNPVEAKRSMNF